jgi:DNA-directed RNA polymerase subunit RPC12/RpoP
MQMRCARCSMSFGVSQDELDLALGTMEKEGAKHYDVRCPRCRQTNHLSLEQVRRAARRPPASGAPSQKPGAD